MYVTYIVVVVVVVIAVLVVGYLISIKCYYYY